MELYCYLSIYAASSNDIWVGRIKLETKDIIRSFKKSLKNNTFYFKNTIWTRPYHHVDNTIHWRNFSPVFNTIGFTNTPLAFINRKYKFTSFYGNSITSFLGRTFSRKNVHFNHPSFHLSNYHANASSVTPSECHFFIVKSIMSLEKH